MIGDPVNRYPFVSFAWFGVDAWYVNSYNVSFFCKLVDVYSCIIG